VKSGWQLLRRRPNPRHLVQNSLIKFSTLRFPALGRYGACLTVSLVDRPRCLPLRIHRGRDYDDPESCLLQSAHPPGRTGDYDADKTAGMPRCAGLAVARTGATVAMR
jgi:hypothetical protein